MAEENRVYHRKGEGFDKLVLTAEHIPKPGHGQVLLRMHAMSLNYRDVLIGTGKYGGRIPDGVIPISDGAGEVVELGEGASRFKKGDRVTPNFVSGWITGNINGKLVATSLGGSVDGVAGKYIVIREDCLVRIPEHLSYEEAATLPCAALTAWNSLFEGPYPLLPGQTVLVQGTGGVSIFGLQLAVASGARVIVTSSSDEKLAKAKALGAHHLINYKTHPDWENEVLQFTNNHGVDHIIEVGGSNTTAKSIKAITYNGCIGVIGGLSGFGGEGFQSGPILYKAVNIRGILIGSREMYERLHALVTLQKLKPVIDKVFEFDKLPAALEYLQSGAHFGKIVVKIN